MAAATATAAAEMLAREGSSYSFDQDDAALSGTLAATLSLSEKLHHGDGGNEEEAASAAVVAWVESNLWCWGRSQDGQAGAVLLFGLWAGIASVCV